MLDHHHLLIMRVDATSYDYANTRVIVSSQEGDARHVYGANIPVKIEAWDDPDFQAIVNTADLVTPDGIPLMCALRRLGVRDAIRVYGPAGLYGCTPSLGTLGLTPRGTFAERIGVRAVLLQDTERLLEVEIDDEERDLDGEVPAGDALPLAIVSDHNVPSEDRNLWVSGLVFTPRAP